MISKLPKWVWLGAWILAFTAGFVNVIGVLGFEHQAVTHLTGTVSFFAVSLANSRGGDFVRLGAVILSFLVGTVTSGLIIGNSTLKLGRRYGVALILESCLLLCAIPLLYKANNWGMYCTSFACGLQNAMASTYSGAAVRTTHVSGMFTDIGIILGHYLRRLPVDTNRLFLYLLIISGFLTGGVIAAWCFASLRYSALIIPAIITAAGAIAYEAGRYAYPDR